jgi:anti-sigma factor RsiW
MIDAAITELEISAFVDGELPPERARLVAARLAADPVLAERVERYRADKAMLARVYDPVLDWPLPETLEAAPRPAPHRAAAYWGVGMLAAAAVAAVVVGTSLLRGGGADPLVAAAIDAYRDRGAGADGFDTAGRASEAMNAEIARRVGAAVKAPDLAAQGWSLARVEFRGGGHAGRFAELRYEDAGGRLFTIALQARPGASRFEVTRQRDLAVCIWQNDELEAVMLARDMNQHEMLKVATATYGPLGF